MNKTVKAREEKARAALAAANPEGHNQYTGGAGAVKTQNEGMGYHGSAFDSYVREKHGPETGPNDLSEKDSIAAGKAADDAFSRNAHSLVNAGHFKTTNEARDFLDSRAGRHIGDEIGHTGDAAKVKQTAGWLKMYKKDKSLPFGGG